MIGRKEFQKRFPDAAMTDFTAPEDLNAESGLFWANRDAVRVCEYWVKRPHRAHHRARLAHGGETHRIITGCGSEGVLARVAG